jgi:hypothetical protein
MKNLIGYVCTLKAESWEAMKLGKWEIIDFYYENEYLYISVVNIENRKYLNVSHADISKLLYKKKNQNKDY